MTRQRGMKTKTVVKLSEPDVIISDDDDDDNTQHVGDTLPLGLCPKDLQILERKSGRESWLNDRLIHAGQRLIQKEFPSVSGLQDPILSATLTFDVQRKEFIQIVNISNSHWICLSSLGCPPDTIQVYDSLPPSYARLAGNVQEVIASILFTKSPSIEFTFPDVQRQRTAVNCGLFALAFAHHLCSGQDPEQVIFREDVMRKHFIQCLQDEQMKPFPSAPRKTTLRHRPLTGSLNVYCTCRLPDIGDQMLQCDNCTYWFHFTCIKDAKKLAKEKSWLCPLCVNQKLHS